jgi:hypothetical protein
VGEKGTWACGACSLINAPNEDTCELCGTLRDGGTNPAIGDCAGPSPSGLLRSDKKTVDCGLAPADKGKGKKKKVSKFERLRLTGGNGEATQVRGNLPFKGS